MNNVRYFVNNVWFTDNVVIFFTDIVGCFEVYRHCIATLWIVSSYFMHYRQCCNFLYGYCRLFRSLQTLYSYFVDSVQLQCCNFLDIIGYCCYFADIVGCFEVYGHCGDFVDMPSDFVVYGHLSVFALWVSFLYSRFLCTTFTSWII